MNKTELGERLRQARISAKLTQPQACAELEIPNVQSLSNYEKGVNSPPLEKLAQLATLYGVSTDWLIYGDEVSPKKQTDYLIQFINAVDRLQFKISTKRIHDPDDPIDYWDEYIVTLKEFKPELYLKWGKLRNLLDSNNIDESEYKTLMKKTIDDIRAGKYNLQHEDNSVPF